MTCCFYFQVPFQPAQVMGKDLKDARTMPPPKTTNLLGKNKKDKLETTSECKNNQMQTLAHETKKSVDSKSAAYGNFNKDVEVAMEMDDSFTCSMASQALAMATKNLGSNLAAKSQICIKRLKLRWISMIH